MSEPLNLAQTLCRPELRELVPYQSARRIGGSGEVWINANELATENRYQLDSAYNRYPEFQPSLLAERYAAYAGVTPQQLLITRGADEGIELLIRAFCQPQSGEQVVICPPTYGMYGISARTCNVAVSEVPLTDGFELDLAALKRQIGRTRLFFVCSPNNPTGNLIPAQQIRELLDLTAGNALVVVDEAYIEFCPEASVAGWLAEYPNLVVLRTLSKAFGLAGLRCGFTLASADIIQVLSKVIAPYPIPAPVAEIAQQALSETGIARMRQQVAELLTLRDSLARQLEGAFEIFGAEGNYLLLRTSDSRQAMETLANAGIIARDQSRQPALENCIRLTIGTPAEMQATAAALLSEAATKLSAGVKGEISA